MESKKPFYSIGQVAEYLELPQSVLRYWETVFDALQPSKSPGGSRRYSDLDLKILVDIKHLLYDRGFTIRGANKILNQKYHIETKVRKQTMEKTEDKISVSETGIKTDQKEPYGDNYLKKDILKKIIGELKEIVKVLDQ